MHLSKEILKQIISEQKIIMNYYDLENQLTANGFDMRLAAIVEIENGGKLAVNKADNIHPKLGRAFVLKEFESRLEGYLLKEKNVLDKGSVKLNGLKPYFAITCEEVNTPNNLMIHITPRSSLFRLTQSMLGCSFGEAGYKGFLTFMLMPFLDSEIELGARFAQISFSELKGHGDYAGQKEKSYQGGKLF